MTVCACYLAADPRLHSGRPVVIWGGGRTTRLRVKHLMEHGVRCHAWVDVDRGRIGMKIRGMPVHPIAWLDRPDHPFVLIYVTNHGARDHHWGAEPVGICQGQGLPCSRVIGGPI